MFTTIVEQLRKIREEKGFSREDVSSALHIRPYIIEAIEEDRLDELPSMVQAKGFIRLYSEWLGLNAQELLAQLDKNEEVVQSSQISSSDAENEDPQKKTSVSFFKVFSRKRKKVAQDNDITPIENDVPALLKNETTTTSIGEDSLEDNPESLETVEIDSDSQNLFEQIGEKLRICREKLDISVDDIEKLTHIRARYLLDMEAGNFNNIPSLVQARGLLAGYTSFLNLDNDEILGLFAEALQKRRIELLPPEPEKIKGKPDKKRVSQTDRTGIFRFITFDFLIGSVTIIGLVGFGIFSANLVISSNREKEAAPPPIAEVLLQVPTENLSSILTPTSELTQVSRNPDSIGLLPTSKPEMQFDMSDSSPTPPVPDLGEASMQVYIVPNQRVFLQVTTGKKVAFLGRTVPGNAYPFTSDERIEIVCGNAAALQIYYNQRDLGTLGLTGQPLRLIFSKDGISTPTPVQPSAPTSTQMPTLTLRPTATMIPLTVTPLIP